MILGIDEAGRGPVLGPMLLAIAGINDNEKQEKQEKLKSLGVKDSKKLSPKKRKQLFLELTKILDYIDYKIIWPVEIDLALNTANYNLNLLEADITAELISDFILKNCQKILNNKEKAEKQITIFIDLPSSNQSKYVNYLKKSIKLRLSKNLTEKEKELLNLDKYIELIAEHKADDKYIIVSAASIIAKVKRDNEINNLKISYGKQLGDLGSGYPSDPKTKEFLKQNYNKNLPFVRTTWESYKKLKNQDKNKNLNEIFKKESNKETSQKDKK